MNKYLKSELRTKIPEYVYFILTEKCPLNCPQCYNSSNGSKDMSFEIFVENYNQARDIGTKKIVLIGGEVLYYKDIIKVLEYINGGSLYCTFATSGYGIEKVLDLLKKTNNIYPIISINASERKINELTRDGYNYSIRALELLKKYNIPYSVNWVAHHSNVDDFSNLLKMVFEYNAENVVILQAKYGCNSEIFDNLTMEDVNKLRKTILDCPYKDKIMVDRCSNFFRQELLGQKIPTVGTGCCAGEFVIAVNVDGKYQPCQHMSIISESTTLKDAWQVSEIFNEFRKNKRGCIADIV